MKKMVAFFLKNRAFAMLILFLVLAGGLYSYFKMGKLEDAPFTIKQALVTTAYHGLCEKRDPCRRDAAIMG